MEPDDFVSSLQHSQLHNKFVPAAVMPQYLPWWHWFVTVNLKGH